MRLEPLANALNEGDETERLSGRGLGRGRGPGPGRVPKYLRLSEGIANAIDSGELQTGEQLPGESELASQLPASLGTIQKALGHLAERGVVVRRHGAGTFVAPPPNQLPDLWHFRFLDDDGHSLLPVFTNVTHVGHVETVGPWTDFLGGDTHHLQIDREIDVNHEFTVASRIFLPGDRFEALGKAKPSSLDNVNIRAVLRERFDAPTIRVIEQVGAETIPDDICRMLKLVSGAIGMVVHVLGFGCREIPLSYQMIYSPPNTRRLEIRPRNP